MAQMAMGFLCETNDHPANDHPNNDHPTNDHPTNDHPTNDHPTNDHPSRRDIVTERSEEDWLVILMEQLVTAEYVHILTFRQLLAEFLLWNLEPKPINFGRQGIRISWTK
jgi:hypothetical protein